MKAALVPMLLLAAPATARGLPELQQALLRPPPQTTAFAEFRFTRLLTRAATARGTLEYRVDGSWVRSVESPHLERAEIVNDEIRVRRGQGPERRIALARAPQLRLLLDCLQALLGGKLTELEPRFAVSLEERDSHWQLTLVPRESALSKTIARIEVRGRGENPRCIRLSEPDGDTSFTLLGEALPVFAGPVTREGVEAACGPALTRSS